MIKVKEELESVKCYSIEFSGKFCSNTADQRCTAEKRNDLLGREYTTEQVTSWLGLGVPVPLTQKPETKGPTTRSKFRRAATVLPESFRTPKVLTHGTSAHVSRLALWSWSARTDLPELAGKRTRIVTEELCNGPCLARDDLRSCRFLFRVYRSDWRAV